MPARAAPALALCVASALWACATPSEEAPPDRPGAGPRAWAGGFDRDVYPFPVFDERGEPYEHPFLGGFLVPRPQFVDLDGDGDPDLFVQERSQEMMYFENVGTRESPRFVWRTDRFQDLEVGEWFRFRDLTGDGRLELLAERPYSYIRVFRNEGTALEPRFVLAADSLRDTDGRAIFADRQNMPQVADIDCDGMLDLFLGRVDGQITHYAEAGRRDGLPTFRRVTDRFEGIEIVGQIGTLHGANAMAFYDLTGNGALDLLWGDFFEPSVLLIRNAASCPGYSLRSPPTPLATPEGNLSTSGFNVPVPVDLEGDGAIHLVVGVLGGAFNPITTAATNLHHYRRDAEGVFHLLTDRFLSTVDVGSESVVAVGDVTGNGLPDLVVGNKIDPVEQQTGRLYVFRNSGTATSPSFRLTDTLSLAPAYHYAPALGDLFGDGRAHLALGTWNDGVHVYRNVGEGDALRFEPVPELHLRLPRGSHAVPALHDLDGDGLLDLLVGRSGGDLVHYRNTGTRERPRFELEEEGFQGIDVGRRSAPAFGDVDGDGSDDLLIGREAGGAVLYRNVGQPDSPRFERDEWFEIPLHRMSTPALADVDGNGRAELFSGTLGGGVLFFRIGGR